MTIAEEIASDKEVGIEDQFLGTPDDSVPSSTPEMDFTDEFAGIPSAPSGNGGNEGGHGGAGQDDPGEEWGGMWAKGGLIRRPYAKGGIVSVMPTKFNKY